MLTFAFHMPSRDAYDNSPTVLAPECFQISSAFFHPADSLTKRQRSALHSAFNPAGSCDFYPNPTLPAMFLCAEKWKYSRVEAVSLCLVKMQWPVCPEMHRFWSTGEIPTLSGLQGSSRELKMHLLFLALIHYKNCRLSWLHDRSKVIDFPHEIYQFPEEQFTQCTLFSLTFVIWAPWQHCSVKRAVETFVICSFQPQKFLLF